MNQNKTVSVVIPIYNSEKFLKESLESILNQTYNDIEVIAINDGSTDDSLAILKQYSDRVTVISQKNQGLASALNNGLKHMSGKWFKWFSPDDIMLPNCLEELVCASRNQTQDTIIYSNWRIINEKDETMRDFFESNFNDLSKIDYAVRLLDGQQINVNTSLIPASLIKRGCIFRTLDDPVAIDYDFFLRAALLYDASFYLIEKPLVGYRIHSEQLSHTGIKKTLDYIEKLNQEILEEIAEQTKSQLISKLQEYRNAKPFTKRVLAKGLKFKLIPDWITDKILIYYLNKIRRTR